ncbi:transcriptional regulator [Burkholderia paludis]|uniref:Transcriptional regulator n=2 Tax=Burkholderiaceae TaxID=119060 RepID=A0A6J5F9N0_9BURK|nr:hypothetical protein LMG30113_07366 [Burkholderia paludis]VWC47355.1 transcriptional regulator [Burkholderia paludis]
MIPRTRLEDVTEADIQRLIDNGVRESRTLDFKRELDLTHDGKLTPDEKGKLAEDVCAFANAFGGDLVIGLEPFPRTEGDSAVARAIVPVRVTNPDAMLLDLVNSLRDALEPQLATLHARPVPVAGGGHVIVIRVGPSPNAPHRAVRRGGGHFFLRNSVGKEPMDIHAIRTAFAHAEGLPKRAQAFRELRLTALRERRSQVPLRPGPLLVVHLIPVLSLTRADEHPIEDLKRAAQHLLRAQPATNLLGSLMTNFEGVICTGTRDAQGQSDAYAQVFRDGCIELVGSLLTLNEGQPARSTIFPQQYELTLVQHDLPVSLQALETLGIPAPAYLCLSLLNVREHQVRVTTGVGPMYRMFPAHLSDVVSAPVYLDTFEGAPAIMVGPAIDTVWNAVGVDHSETGLPGRR